MEGLYFDLIQNDERSSEHLQLQFILVDLDGCQISQTNTVEYLQYRQVACKKTKQKLTDDYLIFNPFSSPNLWA